MINLVIFLVIIFSERHIKRYSAVVLCFINFNDKTLMLAPANASFSPFKNLSSVRGYELLEKVHVTVVNDKINVSANGTGISGRDLVLSLRLQRNNIMFIVRYKQLNN